MLLCSDTLLIFNNVKQTERNGYSASSYVLVQLRHSCLIKIVKFNVIDITCMY